MFQTCMTKIFKWPAVSFTRSGNVWKTSILMIIYLPTREHLVLGIPSQLPMHHWEKTWGWKTAASKMEDDSRWKTETLKGNKHADELSCVKSPVPTSGLLYSEQYEVQRQGKSVCQAPWTRSHWFWTTSPQCLTHWSPETENGRTNSTKAIALRMHRQTFAFNILFFVSHETAWHIITSIKRDLCLGFWELTWQSQTLECHQHEYWHFQEPCSWNGLI